MIIGLTGSSGSGKTVASDFFREQGFYVIDFDKISKDVCKKSSPCLNELASFFGEEILNDDCTLNRKHLGEIVFKDKEKLQKLNFITHKYIMESARELMSLHMGENVVLDAPLLFEAGLDSWCDVTLSVISDIKVQIKRITERDGISEDIAKARLGTQHDEKFFASNSDYVVRNDGTVDEFYEKLQKFLEDIFQ